MRTYSQEFLENKALRELDDLLNNVKTSSVLTKEEQDANIQILESAMGIMGTIEEAIANDMMAGQADIDDIGGM